MLPLTKFSASKGKEAENSSLGEILEGTEKGDKAEWKSLSTTPCKKGVFSLLQKRESQRCSLCPEECRQSPELLDPGLPNSLFNDVKRQEPIQTLLT